MRLRTKFMILIGLVVLVSYGITFYRTSTLQKELVFLYASRQARMMHRQILLTRRWVADHNGLFFLKRPGVESNPFLENPEIQDVSGRYYVKRNPAMVTRELSRYAAREGFCRYRVTSLKPRNPANRPDDFERTGLERFEKEGVSEVIDIREDGKGGKRLRYMAPLVVEKSCLACHRDQGYEPGDIRGGLSVTIPLDWAFRSVAHNNRVLLVIGVITICLVSITIFLFIDVLVVRRLATLARAMDRYPARNGRKVDLPGGADEIGRLAGKFRELCDRLDRYQQELDQAREQVFQGEKLAALGRLTAGIAHEINNPLGGMLNCLKSMEEAPEDREMRQRYLGLLAKGLRRIGHTVRQLLNFGRPEPLQLRAIDIDDLVRECFGLLEYGMQKIGLTLDLHLGRPCPVDVEALKQVIVNISLNAIQAMPDGGTFTVRTFDSGPVVVLEFEDTGAGIAAADLDKIFDPFFSTKEVGEGTGLGLSVTYSLVQRMRGTIRVDSRPGRGSCFRVELPAAAETEAQ